MEDGSNQHHEKNRQVNNVPTVEQTAEYEQMCQSSHQLQGAPSISVGSAADLPFKPELAANQSDHGDVTGIQFCFYGH